MIYEHFDKIIETKDLSEVNKLCSNGWVILCVTDNPGEDKEQNPFFYSVGFKDEIF